MAFVDEVIIQLQSGAGGNGCVSFRREKYIPKGGPDGGNGGSGGSIYLKATRDKQSLLDFKFLPKFKAKRGEHGMGSDCDGRGGEDLIIPVPPGTLVFDAEDNLIHDLDRDGMLINVAKGGRGGRGNRTFCTSRLRAPRISTPGEPGEAVTLRLELRLLADVGLVGLPNAGKSSFLTRISRARPKIASYPFTTLEPNLGVVDHKDVSFVVADLPGLIEGASEGAGLGHKFLRHVNRTRLILHLVELGEDIDDLEKQIESIRNELGQFDKDLLARDRRLVFTKADLFSEDKRIALQKKIAERGLSGFYISSHTGFGVETLLDTLSKIHAAYLNSENPAKPSEADENELAVSGMDSAMDLEDHSDQAPPSPPNHPTKPSEISA